MDIVAILQWVLIGIGTIGITKVIINKLDKLIDNWFVDIRKDINKTIDIKLKDPEFREIAYKAIFYAQKAFSNLAGGERLEKAIEFVQIWIPTKIGDDIARSVIQKIYNELKEPIKSK